MKKRMLIAVTAILAGSLVAGGTALADGDDSRRTLVVDKDKVQCPDADFQSIQAAVVDAAPGDRILVCPDLYTESVTVPKTLTIEAVRSGEDDDDDGARRDCFDPLAPPPDPARDAIVDGGTFSFFLAANEITLEGFVVQGSVHGIQTSPLFSGYQIKDNLIRSNSFGILLESSDALEIRIEKNCFRGHFNGIRTEAGFFANARIERNDFFRNSLGILVQDGGVNLRIEHNESREDTSFFLRGTLYYGRISHNRSTMSGTFGAAMELAGVGNEISHNRLRQAGTGINFVLFNTDHYVHHNDIENMSRFGISASFNTLDNSMIADNQLSENGLDGINLRAGNTGNRIEENRADRNGSDGIHAQDATANVFARNRLKDNVEHDAHDDNRAANT